MTLIKCKECKREISSEVDTCPQCGVSSPSISYQEQQLLFDLESEEDAVIYYRGLAGTQKGSFKNMFLTSIPIIGSTIKDCHEAADRAQERGYEIREKLSTLRDNK